ncbi:MAG: tRNA (guanine(6)-N2)-methyltransferase [Candidatus Aenigmatarchaeota archaeon]
MKIEFIATCNKGLEEIAALEVSMLINQKAQKIRGGMIKFEGNLDDIFILNYFSKTLHKIYYVLLEDYFSSLNDIYSKIKSSIDFTQYIYPTQTFAIVANRIGNHNFTSLDVARVAGQAVIDSYLEKKNIRLKVNLDNPNISILVDVMNDKFFVALDTTGKSLHARWYRKCSHISPLKPTVAASMILLSNYNKEFSLIDPFCGIGTIPIEAYHLINRVPNLNRSFEFEKFYFLDRNKWLDMLKYRGKDEKLKIYGSDINENYIECAKENSKEAYTKIEFFVEDALNIDYSNYDFVITDLPYGIRKKYENLEELYKNFINRVLNSNIKKFLVITARWKLVEKFANIKSKYFADYRSLTAAILEIDV